MPEAGGSTTQSGILYQNSISALYLGRLLDTTNRPDLYRVERVRVEAPAEVDDTIVTFADAHRDFIQAKENLRANSDEWRNLWLHFDKQFRDKDFQHKKDRLVLYIGLGLREHQDLQGLCERASTSLSIEEWYSRLSLAQKTLLEQITPLLIPVGINDDYSLDLLAHIDVKILPLEAIERDRLYDWMPRTNRNQVELFRLLRDRVGGTARVKGIFEPQTLLQSLIAESPNLIFEEPTDLGVLRNSLINCSSLLRQQKDTFADTSIHLEQKIVDEIIKWLLDDGAVDQNVAILLDQAGMGKTVVMHDVLKALENKNINVFAIKADQQISGVNSLEELRNKLGLSYPIEQIISRLAQTNRVVVLIDQIDALSLSLAHDQQTINIALDLLGRLRRIPNVRLLLSCRIFDYHADPRLKTVEIHREFQLSALTEEQIQTVLGIFQIDYKDLPPATKELLTIPLHLDLFVRAVSASPNLISMHEIGSLQELYALIWQYVVCRQESNSPAISDRIDVISRLADYMDKRQRIAVPKSILNVSETKHLEQAVNWLASIGILVSGKAEWSFLHQTFFDYCYARKFVETENDVVSNILTSRQGIFERPKLIQVMAYLRGYDQPRYRQDLKQLLITPKLRFHLKNFLFRWFGAIFNPTEDEWLIAVELLLDNSRFRQVMSAMHRNAAWLPYMKKLIPNWLGDETRVDATLVYLESLVDIAQVDVVSLVEPFLGRSNEWNNRIVHILFRVRKWYTEEAVQLYESSLQKLVHLNRLNYYPLQFICTAFPAAGCRLIYYILNRALDDQADARKNGGAGYKHSRHLFSSDPADQFQDIDSSVSDSIEFVSNKSSGEFLDRGLLLIEKAVSQENGASDDYKFALDSFYDEIGLNISKIQTAFVGGMTHALIRLSKTNPVSFRLFAQRLKDIPYQTPQSLLANVFGAVPEMYSAEAFDFVIDDYRRLNLGRNQYCSRQMFSAIYPYLSDVQRVYLEQFILGYLPIQKHRKLDALRWSGIEQYRLLLSIPNELMSNIGQRRLSEWKRKFPDIVITDQPFISRGGAIVSPIDKELTQKMSIDNWLIAMRKYQKGVEHNDFLKGGAGELSRVLTELIKSNPNKYHELYQRMPLDTDDPYVLAFAYGFSESLAPAEWTFDVFRKYAGQPNRNIQRQLVSTIEKLADKDVPDDIVANLYLWIQSPMGDDELWWSKGEKPGDVFSSYLNSDRGAAFATLMRIFDAKATEQARNEKWRVLELIASDASAALRIGAVHELMYMIHYDREKAWSLFKLLVHNYEFLLNTNYAADFLYWSMYKNFLNLKPYIEYMMQSDIPLTQESAAGLISVAAISEGAMESNEAFAAAQGLAELAVTGNLSFRKGSVRIYAHNLARESNKAIRSVCEEKLRRLIDDEDEGIRNDIVNIFPSLREEHFLELYDFIGEFAKSEKHGLSHQVADYLWKYGKIDPERTLSLFDALLVKKEQDEWLSGAEEAIRFVLLVCASNASTAPIVDKAINTFDILMQRYTNVANQVLVEWDRR